MKPTIVKSTLPLKSWDVMIKKKTLEKGRTHLSCYDRKMWTCIRHLVEKLLGISKLFQNVKYFILYAEHVALSSFSYDWKDIYAQNNSEALDWGEVSRSLGETAQGMTYENTPSSLSPTYETAKRPGASQLPELKTNIWIPKIQIRLSHFQSVLFQNPRI